MNNTEYINDLSLLRPFDLEAAKKGEEICWSNIQDEVKFIGVTSAGLIAYESGGELGFGARVSFRMKPLAWVEGKPVYKGDVLYGKKYSKFKYIVSTFSEGIIYTEPNETGSFSELSENLTWNKPKQKVKRKIWINVYPDGLHAGYDTKAMADYNCNESVRIACVESEIEYED